MSSVHYIEAQLSSFGGGGGKKRGAGTSGRGGSVVKRLDWWTPRCSCLARWLHLNAAHTWPYTYVRSEEGTRGGDKLDNRRLHVLEAYSTKDLLSV